MAVMSSLRDKTHIILYTLLAAFLALIVFEWGMNFSGFSGKKANQAGKVNGKAISFSQYDEVYKEMTENFRRSNPGAEMTPETELALQEQAWNTVVDQTLLDQQFEKFGITLQDQEVIEALAGVESSHGDSPEFHESATGAIDRKKLESARRDPRNKDLWLQIEKIVRRELKVNKLIRALQTLDHVTDRELGDIVNRQFTRFSASFIPFPLSFAGADSNFPVKDEEVKKYYDEHKELFKQLPSRKADFVFFPLIPSSKDSLAVRTELETIRAEFSTAVNDSDYVKVQSDRPTGINKVYTRADFSPAAGDAVFNPSNLKPGTLVGPIADRGEYRLDQDQAGDLFRPACCQGIAYSPALQSGKSAMMCRECASLRHIFTSSFRQEFLLRRLPENILLIPAVLPMAAISDGSARIGWCRNLQQAVFNASPGSVVGPVQTQFGLHIIKVTGFDQYRSCLFRDCPQYQAFNGNG